MTLGGDGSHFHSIFPEHLNVVIADILGPGLAAVSKKYGYKTVQLAEDTADIPLKDREFDFVSCSSIIEHVTGPKEQFAWTCDANAFEKEGKKHQWRFADEIKRISKQYYVQTPCRYFLPASHSWLPGIVVLLSRTWLVTLLKFTNRFWPQKDRARLASAYHLGISRYIFRG